MDGQKRIALTAHDAMKAPLAAWVFANADALRGHSLTATGNTARLIAADTGLKVDSVRAGALGGDMQLGALMAEDRLDILVFFIDPLGKKPFDIDPAPLLRVASLSQTALALNETTADFIVRSELLSRRYHRPSGTPALPAVPARIGERRSDAR